jgi:hypothetical protein
MHFSTKDHGALAYRYMQVLAVQLASALDEHGISDAGLQRKVVESFLFSVGVGWDQFYITDFASKREKVRPAICFIDGDRETIVPGGDGGFHELAPFGVAASVFEPEDPASDLEFVYDNGANGDVPFSKQLRSSE